MALLTHTTKGALVVALTLVLAACDKQDEQLAAALPTGNSDKPALTLAECDKLPDPKPRDESAAGKATAVSEGMAARQACKKAAAAQQDKANAEPAERAANQRNTESGQAALDGARKPIRELKY